MTEPRRFTEQELLAINLPYRIERAAAIEAVCESWPGLAKQIMEKEENNARIAAWFAAKARAEE
jgi:hypothetical protein